MSTIQITCDNCGAKYKLPETFTSPRAKCQKCGSVIDVAAQREHAKTGEATASQAARPAVDRSRQKPARAAAGAAAGSKTGGRASSRRRKGADDTDHGDGEAPRGRAPKKKDNTPMIFGGIGLVGILVVVIVFLMQGENEDPETNTTTQNPPANQTENGTGKPAAPAPDGKPENPPADTPPADAGKPAAGDTPPADAGNPAAGDTPPAAGKPADASTPAPKIDKNAPRWMREKVTTVAEVTDPKTYGEVPWDRLDAAKKEQAQTWAAEYAGGGRPGIRAEAELRKEPYLALFGVVDHLRGLDYADPIDTGTGYMMNRFLTDITEGLQTGFVAAEMDEDIDPRKMQWNGKTVKTWLQIFSLYEDEAAFKKSCRERKAKAAKEGK